MEPFFEKIADGVILRLQVQPRSSKNQIVGPQGDALKVKLTSPPVDGAANKCCCAFLAKLLGFARTNVVIVSGESSRKKRVMIRGVRVDEVLELIK